MDMSNAYGKWVRENLPGVPVIYDHFHVIKAIKQACGYRDFKYFRLKVFDLPNLKPPRPHAAKGRATFPRTTGFCARERRWSGPNHTTFTPPLGSLDVSGRGGRPRPPATAPQRDLRLIVVAGRPEVGPYRLFDFPFVRDDESNRSRSACAEGTCVNYKDEWGQPPLIPKPLT